MDIEQIMTGSVIFKKAPEDNGNGENRVKTKAKKSTYAKGTHGSGAAKMKAAYKKKTQQRKKK